MQLGFTNVARYPGGIGGWATAGYFRQATSADGVEFWMDPAGANAEPVDVRSAADFAAGHIPGARNEPLATLAVDPATTLADLFAQALVLYDAAAPSGQLFGVAVDLEEAGFRGVYVYTTGFADWVAAGKTVE